MRSERWLVSHLPGPLMNLVLSLFLYNIRCIVVSLVEASSDYIGYLNNVTTGKLEMFLPKWKVLNKVSTYNEVKEVI